MAQSNPTRVLTNADLVHVIDELDKNQMRKNIGVVDSGSESEIRRLDHRIDVANTDIEAIREAIAEDEFDPEIGYTLGSYVWHGNKLYVKVYNSNTPEAWNPEHWNEISVLNQNNASYFIYGTATYEEVQLAFAKRQAVYAIKSITNGIKVGVFGSAYNGGYKFVCNVDGSTTYVWTVDTSDNWSEVSYSGGGSGSGIATYITYGDNTVDFDEIVAKVTSGEIVLVKYNATVYPDEASIFTLSEIQSSSEGIDALLWSKSFRYPNSQEYNIATIELNNSPSQKWILRSTDLNPYMAGAGITFTDRTGMYEGIKEISVTNPIPAVTSSDNNKVLTASYSEGVASYSWQTNGGGVSGDIVIYDLENANYIDFDEVVGYHTNNKLVYFYSSTFPSYGLRYKVCSTSGSTILLRSVGSGILAGNVTSGDYYLYNQELILSKDTVTGKIIPGGIFQKFATIQLNLTSLGIEQYKYDYLYSKNDVVYYYPTPTSSINPLTINFIYRCKAAPPAAGHDPYTSSMYWEPITLDEYYSRLKKVSVTPTSGTIDLIYAYEGKVIESSADITAITNSDDVDSVIIQWTASSSTAVPTMPSGYHASSDNPSVLTVGKSYQLSLTNTFYTIKEFS